MTQIAGERLDQDDAGLMLELARRAWTVPLNAAAERRFRVTGAELLRAVGSGTAGADYRWLRDSIRRLLSATFIYESAGKNPIRIHAEGGTHLVQKYKALSVQTAVGESVEYEIVLDDEFATLFAAGYTVLKAAERYALRDPLAKALHAYLSTQHNSRYCHPYSELQSILGRTAQRPDKFAKSLDAAIAEISERIGWVFTKAPVDKRQEPVKALRFKLQCRRAAKAEQSVAAPKRRKRLYVPHSVQVALEAVHDGDLRAAQKALDDHLPFYADGIRRLNLELAQRRAAAPEQCAKPVAEADI